MLGLNITLSMTADGKQQYLQILSDDAFSVNVVLLADKIKLKDVRPDKVKIQ